MSVVHPVTKVSHNIYWQFLVFSRLPYVGQRRRDSIQNGPFRMPSEVWWPEITSSGSL